MSIIPKEQLGGFQRWTLNSFDQPPVVAPASSPPPRAEEPAPLPPEADVEIALPTAADIEKVIEEARQSGYEEGYSEGKTTAQQETELALQQATGQMNQLVSSMEMALGELDQSVANQILGLALEVARQLTSGVIKARSDFLLPIIKESIASLPLHHGHITIHLHPEDATLVRSGLGEQPSQNSLQIFENTEITPGGCRLIAGSSEVDATLETRWRRVLDAIGAEPQEWLNP